VFVEQSARSRAVLAPFRALPAGRGGAEALHQPADLFKALLSSEADTFFARALHLVFLRQQTGAQVVEALVERLRGHLSPAACERFAGGILGGLSGSGGRSGRHTFGGVAAGDALTVLWSAPAKLRLLLHASAGRGADPKLFARASHGVAAGPDLPDADLPRLLLVGGEPPASTAGAIPCCVWKKVYLTKSCTRIRCRARARVCVCGRQGAFCFGPNPTVPEVKVSVARNLERLYEHFARLGDDDSSDDDSDGSGVGGVGEALPRQEGAGIELTSPAAVAARRRSSARGGSALRRPSLGWTTLVGFDSHADRATHSETFSGDLGAAQGLCVDLGCGG
jgi:hypothetical protein